MVFDRLRREAQLTHEKPTTRMTPAAFEQWCRALTLPPSTRDYLATIRGRLPVRRVTSRAGNVSGIYPSQKMGVTIQFESHKVELWTILVMDHDPEVLKFFDQPDTFKLCYPVTQAGKIQGHYYTPDFLVLRKRSGHHLVFCVNGMLNRLGSIPFTQNTRWCQRSVYFEEWKAESELHRLGSRSPMRYQPIEGGGWRCPPAEEAVAPLGLSFRIQSSAELESNYIDNLIFLEDYFGVALSVPAQVHTYVLQRIQEIPGLPSLHWLAMGQGFVSMMSMFYWPRTCFMLICTQPP
jgi:putative transposase